MSLRHLITNRDTIQTSNIVIFSLPRTGTKLLANILENFGYHNHGEWFSVRSTYIEDGKIFRRTEQSTELKSFSKKQFLNLTGSIERFNLYKKHNKNTITIWPAYLAEFPFMLYEFGVYHWVGIRRNCWDQILSYYISSVNFNFDGLTTSKPLTIKEEAFRKMYWDYHKVSAMQDWLVENKQATILNFEDLIAGKSSEFGTNYVINSKDEHTNLELLIENLDQTKEFFENLEKSRAVFSS
jgi:hypothetical protein